MESFGRVEVWVFLWSGGLGELLFGRSGRCTHQARTTRIRPAAAVCEAGCRTEICAHVATSNGTGIRSWLGYQHRTNENGIMVSIQC